MVDFGESSRLNKQRSDLSLVYNMTLRTLATLMTTLVRTLAKMPSKAWFTIHLVSCRLASKEAVSDATRWNRKNPIQHITLRRKRPPLTQGVL